MGAFESIFLTSLAQLFLRWILEFRAVEGVHFSLAAIGFDWRICTPGGMESDRSNPSAGLGFRSKRKAQERLRKCRYSASPFLSRRLALSPPRAFLPHPEPLCRRCTASPPSVGLLRFNMSGASLAFQESAHHVEGLLQVPARSSPSFLEAHFRFSVRNS